MVEKFLIWINDCGSLGICRPLFFLFRCLFCFVYLGFFSIFFFLFFRGGYFVRIPLFRIGSIIRLDFLFDYISLGFFMCVSLISSIVFIYSYFYMEGGLRLRRFYTLVFLFVLSIFFLVFSGNFFLLIVGWDGLGLVSFCLVIFYDNKTVLESGLLTVFRNRVGDAFFLIRFFLFGINGYFGMAWGFFDCSIIFSLLIFFGAITKRAQVPFSAWLPAAIAAPTPVSSLVHSSTLVTAGLYVLIRFNYVFVVLNGTFFYIFSLFTMIIAGLCAVFEGDLKKVVAISTLSQLGLILFVISLGIWLFSFLHMMIHAFFKSILFLATGSLISQNAGGQDSRFFGRGLLRRGSFFCFMVRGLCLSGFPFFIGFYSKDSILLKRRFMGGLSLYCVFLLGCVLTVCYRVRLLYLGFYSNIKGFSQMSYQERSLFFVFILLIRGICWFGGGTFYWFFLFDFSLYLCLYDYLLGISIMMIGGLLFLSFYRTGFLFYRFCRMLFFKWVGDSSNTKVFFLIPFFKMEVSWLEVLGGRGIFGLLYSGNRYLLIRSKISLGFLFVLLVYFFCI